MPLSRDDVKRIAHLARLELKEEEQAAMLGQLNGFFRIVEQMSAVDTRGVEPLYTPLVAFDQRSAPAVQGGLYLVPKVIE